MRRQQTDDQDRDADPEGATTNPKQLLDLAPRSVGVIRKISTECLLQLECRLRLRLGFGKVNNDFYGMIGRQFARPTDDELFSFLIQIAFPERKRVQRMK